MKMIYVASLSTTPDRDSGWIREFTALGWEVRTFTSSIVFESDHVISKIKRRFQVGVENESMQRDLLAVASRLKPSWVHFRMPIEFDRNTILQLKANGSIVTQYFNDDPFSTQAPFGLNRKFLGVLTAYDAHFVYRKHNISSYHSAGATAVFHCPPTYDPVRHNCAEHRPSDSFVADAAFIGHWENDGRVECLDRLHCAGIKVIIRGGGWDAAIKGRAIQINSPVTHAFGAEYNFLYSHVVAGLCFFSKVNNDGWTERALEIIAVGGVLVCERTEESKTYFCDRQEAFLFSSTEELIDIVLELRDNIPKRESVRNEGYRRLLSGNHTIADRAKQINECVRSMAKLY